MVQQEPAIYRFGCFTLDARDERLLGPNGPIKLGNKAFRVLLALLGENGRLVTKDTLFETVWDGTHVSESALTSVIKELRRALGDDARAPAFIGSAYGRGYRFVGEATCQTAAAAPRPAASLRPPDRYPAEEVRAPMLLVGAFEDAAVQDRHPYLGTALREEVLSGLARFNEIRLVADDRPERESAAANAAPGPRDYRLGAVLLPDGAGAKLFARAKRLHDGRVVWAESMALSGLGAAGSVDRIVRRIIGAAFPAVDNDISLGLPPDASDFYDRYLIAKRHAQTARDPGEARFAAATLEGMIAERPQFGLAYPPLVRLYNIDLGWTAFGSSGPAERRRALELAKAGLAADPGNAHSHTVLGFCHLRHGEWDAAARCLENAFALNPNNPVRVREVATGLVCLGEFDRARALFDLSLDLQPVPDDAYFEDRCQLALLQGEPAQALGFARRINEPRLWSSLYEGLSLLELDEAGAEAKLSAWRAWVSHCWHRPGQVGDDQLQDWIAVHHPLPPDLKRAFLGRVTRAFQHIPA